MNSCLSSFAHNRCQNKWSGHWPDVYLVMDPNYQISFFESTYRRHTNFEIDGYREEIPDKVAKKEKYRKPLEERGFSGFSYDDIDLGIIIPREHTDSYD